MNNYGYDTYNSQLKNKKNKTLAIILGCFLSVCLVVAFVFLGIFMYVQWSYELFPVSGQSMAKTINANGIDEDFVFVEKTQNVDYQDIIVYNKSTKEDLNMVIKRLIAKGGDWIGFRRTGNLIENFYYEYEMVIKYNGTGEWLKIEEKYVADSLSYSTMLNEFTKTSAGQDLKYEDSIVNGQTQTVTFIQIPQNYVFYVGDNRNAGMSYDCIDYGPMKQENIYGKVKILLKGKSNQFGQILKQFFGVIEWK